MSIKVTCPNGHALKVKDEFAGRTGRCPRCKVKVQVPAPVPDDFNDDSIMDLLHDGPAAKGGSQPSESEAGRAAKTTVPKETDSLPVHEETSSGDSKTGGSTKTNSSSIFASASGILGASSSFLGKMKRCKKCGAESPESYRVCPTCQTYFSDAGRRTTIPKTKCPGCGQHIVPGDVFCGSCGADLQS